MPKEWRLAILLFGITPILCWTECLGAAPMAQPFGWVRQNYSYDNTFYAVDFVDANVGTIVGSGGIILHTTDGGASWVEQASGTAVTLYDVAFFDAMKGLAVGQDGTTLWTLNGGATWDSTAIGTSSDLRSISILDENTIVVVGVGVSVRTTDGGVTWVVSAVNCTGFCFWAASFADPSVGMGVGENMVTMRSLDGGVTWNYRSIWYGDGCASAHFNGVACLGSDTAFAAGYYRNTCYAYYYGRIWRTIDGGISWGIVYSSSDESYRCVSFLDRGIGTAVGKNGKILRSTDGGLTWGQQQSGTNVELYDVCFIDANTGTAVGASGVILRTTDGGATWVRQMDRVTTASLSSVHFLDSNTGIAVGSDNTIVRTTNGGGTWTLVYSRAEYGFRDVAFNGGSTGVAVGWADAYYEDKPASFSNVCFTTDGGLTWTPRALGFEHWGFLPGCRFATADTAIAVGFEGPWPPGTAVMERSTDGGVTWVRQTIPVQDPVKVFFCDGLTGTVIGVKDIVRTADGGATWTHQYASADDLQDLWFTDPDTGTVVGASGTILRTIDGGANWTPQTSGTSATLNGVCFLSANTGTVVGDSGTILRTTNGGAEWRPQESGTTNTLYGVHFTDAMRGTVVGTGGVILRTETGGAPVGVRIERWGAEWAGDHALVTWVLRREDLTSEPTFEISRSPDGGVSFEPIVAPRIRLERNEYSFCDYTTEPGSRYIYRVVIRENAESIASFEAELQTPALSLALAQNYPNPFNPKTTIAFTLPAPGVVTVEIYDGTGRFVRRVLKERLPAGPHEVSWDGRSAAGTEVASGVYFCRLAIGKRNLSRKIVIIR